MDTNIPKMYKRYGQYINTYRAFPLDVDGLKPVERRILLVAYQEAKDKFVKSARIDGTTIAKYHPHSSVYLTIVQLANQNFLDKQGNFGNTLGVDPSPPAASRYTECKLSKRILDMCFQYIKYVPWDLCETDEKEPLYIPAMYPLCFLGTTSTQGIGFGYRTLIPCYHEKDLKKRLLWLISPNKKENDKGPIISPISDCQILSSQDDLLQLLTTGKSTIKFKGIIQEDSTNFKCTLKSWPDGRRFESILTKLQIFFENMDVSFSDLSNEKNGTNVVFTVLKQRNREKIYQSFVSKLNDAVTGNVTYEINVCDLNKQVLLASVDNMLLTTYSMFKSTSLKMITSEIKRNLKIISENELLQKIKPYLALELKNDTKDINSIIQSLFEKVSPKYTYNDIKELIDKHKISKLLTVKFDSVILLEKIKELENNIIKIDDFVLKQYENM